MFINDLAETLRDMIKRCIPAHALSAQLWIQQTTFITQGFTQGRALHAKLAEVGGMLRITRDVRAAILARRG